MWLLTAPSTKPPYPKFLQRDLFNSFLAGTLALTTGIDQQVSVPWTLFFWSAVLCKMGIGARQVCLLLFGIAVYVGSCQTSFSTLSWRGHCAQVLGDSLLCRSDSFLFLGPELMGWGLVGVLVGSCLMGTVEGCSHPLMQSGPSPQFSVSRLLKCMLHGYLP